MQSMHIKILEPKLFTYINTEEVCMTFFLLFPTRHVFFFSIFSSLYLTFRSWQAVAACFLQKN